MKIVALLLLVVEDYLMKLNIQSAIDGSVPSETVVTILTASGGNEEVVVHRDQVKDNRMDVGFIGKQEKRVLVELPRETVKGRWRIWVPESEVAPA